MFAPAHQFFVAVNHARKAARRGDIALAERWLKIAERHTELAARVKKLEQPEPATSQRPPWLNR